MPGLEQSVLTANCKVCKKLRQAGPTIGDYRGHKTSCKHRKENILLYEYCTWGMRYNEN